jgi:membrane-bound lytic murein transglycosylase B
MKQASAVRIGAAGLALGCALSGVLAVSAARAGTFEDCIAGLRGPALASGVDGATFDKMTRGLTPNPDIFDFAKAQPEFKTPIWDYLAGLVDE